MNAIHAIHAIHESAWSHMWRWILIDLFLLLASFARFAVNLIQA